MRCGYTEALGPPAHPLARMTSVLYRERNGEATGTPPPTAPRDFHAALPGAHPTPLLPQPDLAAEFRVAHFDVKLETDRLGLPSFKALGASWATIQALRRHLPPTWRPTDGLTSLAGTLPDLTLATATDGNHGRALARLARILGLRAEILVPEDLSESRVMTIAAEGATVTRVKGSYDDAVVRCAAAAEQSDWVLVSDTSWPGYTTVPSAVIDGYSTILWELDEQLAELGRVPDLVFVQLGVGAFGAAVIRHFCRNDAGTVRIVGVEPTGAACVMASLAAGKVVSVPGPHESVMTGLNCGTPSLVAWPELCRGLDAVVAIDDQQAVAAVRQLAARGLRVGECSAAAVAAASELLRGESSELHRGHLGIDRDSTVVVFATEGVTDAVAYGSIVGESVDSATTDMTVDRAPPAALDLEPTGRGDA